MSTIESTISNGGGVINRYLYGMGFIQCLPDLFSSEAIRADYFQVFLGKHDLYLIEMMVECPR